MHRTRADVEVELQQLEQRFAHLQRNLGPAVDVSAFRRECERVLALVPADEHRHARERIDALLARLHQHAGLPPGT